MNTVKRVEAATFEKLLLRVCSKETSAIPEGWTKENPLYGHCAVVSLIAQNLYKGDLLRASLKETKFAFMRSHYINKIDGVNEDFTAPQFGSEYPKMEFEPRSRRDVLYDPKTGNPYPTLERYKNLAFRFAKALYQENKLFDDPIYQLALTTAFGSQCQKMWFGSVIMHNEEVVYAGANNPIDPLKQLCQPECIRSKIQSRTESMIGACGHAEELGLWEVSKKGIKLSECEIYVAGAHNTGIPWIKTQAEHTCIRCAVQMYNADVKNIFVPVDDRWMPVKPKDAVSQSMAYALGEKDAITQLIRN